MDVVLLIARVLYAALFLGSAVGHLAQTDAMAGYAASRGLPMAKLMAKQMEMVQFNKDMALAGAALAFFWVFSQDPGLTLTDSLFSLG